MENDLLTTAEAGEELGITASRVRQLYLAGHLAGEKRGRDLFIRRADLAAVKSRPGPGRPKKEKPEKKK